MGGKALEKRVGLKVPWHISEKDTLAGVESFCKGVL